MPRDEYFDFLCEYAGAVSSISDKSFIGLMRILYSREFYWSVPFDENRNEDGLTFRKSILENLKVNPILTPDRCTLLEMLLMLAHRCETDIMGEPQNYDRTRYWFWMFMRNLDLDIYFDDEDGNLSDEDVTKINEKINIFLDRKYDENGSNGGMFPLMNNEGKNQQETDIWYQMNAYLLENFD